MSPQHASDPVPETLEDHGVVLLEVPLSAAVVFDLLASLPADFMSDGRDDTLPQDREAF